MPGWRTGRGGRRALLPRDWTQRVVPRILHRDHHHCQWGSLREDHYPYGLCPTVASTVDHIGSATDHSDANLRSLCSYHHGVRTGRQGQRAATEQRNRVKALRKRPEEPHPGDVA